LRGKYENIEKKFKEAKKCRFINLEWSLNRTKTRFI